MATSTLRQIANVERIASTSYSGILITWGDHSFKIQVGKLDANNNYAQFFVDGVDKGYITFTVSRNVGGVIHNLFHRYESEVSLA